MAKLLQQWTTAKTQFETDTGVSKPAKKGSFLFVEWRKSSGLEDALKKVDELYGTGQFDAAPDKKLKELRKAIQKLVTTRDTYMAMLQTAIDNEKNAAGGKAQSDLYRPLKVLKATLVSLVARAVTDLDKADAGRLAESAGLEGSVKQTAIVLKTMATSLQAGCTKGLKTAQEFLQTPTADQWNLKMMNAARDITQPLENIKKWSFPEDLSERRLQLVKDVIEQKKGEEIQHMALSMRKAVTGARDVLDALTAGAGNDPLSADLARLANNCPPFANTATPDQVKAAVKHYIAMVKRALTIVPLLQNVG